MPRASPETTAKPSSPSSRDFLRKLQPGAGSVARADNRHHRHRQRPNIPTERHQRRRVVDHLQPQRIVGLAQSHERDAELSCQPKFPLGVFARANLHGSAGAAAPRQRWQGL
jgi:hypothetical protein